MVMSLEGKTAIITGAAGNIGSATVRLFAERGANVVAIDQPSSDFSSITGDGPNRASIIVQPADARYPDQVSAYVDTAMQRFGRIDIFFNNAGIIGPMKFIDDYTLDDFRTIMDINATGVFLGLKAVLPIMYQQTSGSIINTASVAGIAGSQGSIGYVASKHAVVGLTRAAALESAARNVRVNCIAPGPIAGPMIDSVDRGLGRYDAPDRMAYVPANRYGRPDEVARLVAFLGGDESGFCNGAVYTIDGAKTAEI